MKLGAIATILLLCSRVLAESQESVYYEALKAEEQGLVSKSIELFERAASIDGPYTDEIREILDAYYQALGIEEHSVNFRLKGEMSVHGIQYEESGGEDIKDSGLETLYSVSLFADYSAGSLIHSFGLYFSGNAFLGDTITPLDSTQWNLAPGLGYELLGNSFLICAGADVKFNKEEWRPVLYSWLEKTFFRLNRNRFGAVLSISDEWNYQFTASLLGSWRKFNTRGFNSSIILGARFSTENIFDYDAWLQSPYGDNYPEYEVLWLGPYLRGKFSYKFKYDITIETATNLFYGFIVDGPNNNYEKMSKLTGRWGATFYWSPSILTFYTGLENTIRRYLDIPDTYKGVLSDSMSLWELKLGLKIDW